MMEKGSDSGAESGAAANAAPAPEPGGAAGEKSERPGGSQPASGGRRGRGRARGGVRGRATRLRDPASACLNCADPTPGNFCPNCGQRKTEVLVSVRAMVMDVLEDEFVLNRRLPRTLVNLFFRPGFLTVEHVHGRIARYVRPFKLYIVSSVIFFLLLSFFSLRMLSRAELGGVDLRAAGQDTASVASLDSALIRIDQTLADTALPGPARAALERSRQQLRTQREQTLAARDAGVADAGPLSGVEPSPPPAAPSAVARDTTGDTAQPVGVSGEQRRTLREMLGGSDGQIEMSVNTGSTSVDAAVRRRVDELMELTPRQAIERMVGDFLNYIPTMMFLLLPLFALVLKLLYVRRRRFYAEHFVFLLHWHTFVYLIFSLMLVLRAVVGLPTWLILTFITWTLLYIFIAMKRVYGQGLLMTVIKGSILGWFYVIILSLTIPMAVVVSLLFL